MSKSPIVPVDLIATEITDKIVAILNKDLKSIKTN